MGKPQSKALKKLINLYKKGKLKGSAKIKLEDKIRKVSRKRNISEGKSVFMPTPKEKELIAKNKFFQEFGNEGADKATLKKLWKAKKRISKKR